MANGAQGALGGGGHLPPVSQLMHVANCHAAANGGHHGLVSLNGMCSLLPHQHQHTHNNHPHHQSVHLAQAPPNRRLSKDALSESILCDAASSGYGSGDSPFDH